MTDWKLHTCMHVSVRRHVCTLDTWMDKRTDECWLCKHALAHTHKDAHAPREREKERKRKRERKREREEREREREREMV